MIREYHRHWRVGVSVIPTPGSARVRGDRMGVHPRRIPDREGAACYRDPGVPEEFNVVAVVLF